MTDLRCPLCEVLLAAPPGATEAQPTDVLEAHFADCAAIRVPRAVAKVPEPRPDAKRDG